MKLKVLSILALLSFGLESLAQEAKPNILLLMVDDLGFADFGCYGSEIETPHIDRLANDGLRFSQFYNTGKCHSSRISLLTGLYPIQAGDQTLSRATTVASVLTQAGYAASMTGKWHLDKQPTDFGFENYWGHLSGATDFFKGDDTFRYNGEPWNDFDEDFYTTDANVDYAIDFISQAVSEDKPFFHYIAFNAPHYPLQAPKKDIEKYLNRYDSGWETIRRERFQKQQKLGLFPESMKLPPMPAHVPPWESLSEQQRTFESFRMAIYAAMVDRVDQNIGRLLTFLDEKGLRENTLIMLCSDNGACPFERSKNLHIPPWKANSYYLYDASWATVGNTPLLNYKQTQHEGGISSPLIVNWPNHIAKVGGWESSPGHLIDIMATCIDVADATYPVEGSIKPLQGKSLLPLFKGQKRVGHEDLYFLFGNCRGLRKGDWKIVSFYGQQWELYNLASDRCEQHDVADDYPERVTAMVKRWHELAKDVDQVPAKKRNLVKAQKTPHRRGEWHKPERVDQWEFPSFD